MGFIDLDLRSLPGKAISSSQYDEEFVVILIKKINKALNPTDNGN